MRGLICNSPNAVADSCTRDAIFFDGALPVGKEEIRVQRLERTRKQLYEYRKLYPEAPPEAASPKLPIAHERVIWSQSATSARRVLPPPPPFMVPAAIEALAKTPVGERVHVVPEEADVACARMARKTGSAILSNDSDLSIYDLGQQSCLAFLHTVEKVCHVQPSTTSELNISCICPSDVSKRLKIDSLLCLAFERSLDGTTTTAIVAQRARQALAEADQTRFDAFAAEYLVGDQHREETSLTGLDPRTAEFVVQTLPFRATTSPRVYLPIIHEDSTRDSSWSYGQQLRQLAYCLHSGLSESATTLESVSEYARKGDRIAMTNLPLLKGHCLVSAASAVLDDLDRKTLTKPLHWWMYALRLVVQQKLDSGKKVTPESIATLFGAKGSPFKCNWGDVHLHANIQAVLYSARMLQQILQYNSPFKTRPELDALSLQRLAVALSRLPSIAELFLSIDEVKASTKDQSDATNDMLEEVYALIKEYDLGSANKPGSTAASGATNVTGAAEVFETPRKRIKTTKKTRRATPQQTNMFRLLASDEDATNDED